MEGKLLSNVANSQEIVEQQRRACKKLDGMINNHPLARLDIEHPDNTFESAVQAFYGEVWRFLRTYSFRSINDWQVRSSEFDAAILELYNTSKLIVQKHATTENEWRLWVVPDDLKDMVDNFVEKSSIQSPLTDNTAMIAWDLAGAID